MRVHKIHRQVGVTMSNKKAVLVLSFGLGILTVLCLITHPRKYTSDIAVMGNSVKNGIARSTIYVLNLNWNTFEAITPAELYVKNFVWSKNGEQIIFTYSILLPRQMGWDVKESGIGIVDAQGTKELQILYRFAKHQVFDSIIWDPHSDTKLLLIGHPIEETFIFDLHSKNLEAIEWTINGKRYSHVAVNYDSGIMVGSKDGKIYLLDFINQSVHFLVTGSCPSWLNQKNEFAYVCNSNELCIANQSGNVLPNFAKLRHWKPGNAPYNRLEFSPDDRFIAYYAGGGGENPRKFPDYLGVYDTKRRSEQLFFSSRDVNISLSYFAWRPK